MATQKESGKFYREHHWANWAAPADVAEAAYFLCSDKSGYLTGVILPVDGGNSIGF